MMIDAALESPQIGEIKRGTKIGFADDHKYIATNVGHYQITRMENIIEKQTLEIQSLKKQLKDIRGNIKI